MRNSSNFIPLVFSANHGEIIAFVIQVELSVVLAA